MAKTDASAPRSDNKSTLQSAVDTSRGYIDKTVKAAKDNPGTAAAIGAGVVAAVAGAAYGATKLRQRDPNTVTIEVFEAIDPATIPTGRSVQ